MFSSREPAAEQSRRDDTSSSPAAVAADAISGGASRILLGESDCEEKAHGEASASNETQDQRLRMLSEFADLAWVGDLVMDTNIAEPDNEADDRKHHVKE